MTNQNNGTNNGTQKRRRLQENSNKKQIKVEVTEVEKEEVEVNLDEFDSSTDEFLTPTGEFDWDRYESYYNRKLKPNTKIKTGSHKDVVYCHEPYAQEMYNLLSTVQFDDGISELTVGAVEVGRIHSMSEKWATVDINYREMLYIDLSREDRDVIADVRPGDEVAVKVLSDKTDVREYAVASITEGTKQKVFAELRQAADDGDTAYLGTIKEMIPGGGYLVLVQGIQCFMPGSLAGINKLHDFSSIVGAQMYVVPDSFSSKRGTIVVSHRKYLQAMIPREIENLQANIDSEIKGNVTGTAKYGVFVEFNTCLTGMIHVNDLSPELFNSHKNGTVNPGDEVTFKIKEIVSNEKIILTQKEKSEMKVDNSWEEFTKGLKLPTLIENATIRSIKDYGLFIAVHGSVVGMAHISEFPEGTVLRDTFQKGQEIVVEVTKVDEDTKKVFLRVIGA
jgi:ribosomal protein S1